MPAETPAAIRKERQRARKAQGFLVVLVDVLERERRGLVSMGLLEAGLESDKKAVRDAIHRLLDQTFPPR